MVPISDADEELFATLVAAARLGRIGAITQRLRTRYDEEWDDPLAGLPYALAMLAPLQSGRDDLIKQFTYTEVVETLGDLLSNQPDHWLGRYLRIHTRALLSRDIGHPGYITGERARAVQDARELIERQGAAQWQPWFACSYLVAARSVWQADAADRDAVAELVTAGAAKPRAPVRFPALGSVMCATFLWYRDYTDLPERDAVGAMMAALFPANPAVRRERAGAGNPP